jgi:hypothetical protein
MILKTCRLYNVFGSGTNHGIYVQFMAQSALANQGRKVGLLRDAGTRVMVLYHDTSIAPQAATVSNHPSANIG